jgi:hypothetical protein
VKPYLHSQVSVKNWGGSPEDYLAIHDFIDSSKAAMPDMRHRAILHSAFGIFICERVFGHFIEVAGRKVQVRDIAEQHVIDDLGRIPTLEDYLSGMPMYDWLGGPKRKITTTRIENAMGMEELRNALGVVD